MAKMISGAWELFWRVELPWLLLMAMLTAVVLGLTAPREHKSLLHTLLFLLAGLLAEFGGAVLETAGTEVAGPLLRSAAILATGLAMIRLGGLLLFRGLLPALRLRPPRIAEEVIVLMLYAAWALLRLRLAGMDLASLVTTSAVVTAVIAFSMQDTLGNVLGGLFLELDGSIAVGDWVKLDDVAGRVEDIRWRHTAIRTRNGETVIVPNSSLMKSRFTVIGNPDVGEVRWRRWIRFDVGFEVPPARVLAAARQALDGAQVPHVAQEPAPNCVLLEFGASSARYALRYWLQDPQPDDATDTAVREHLWAALQRAGIPLALPQEVVHRIKEDEARAASLIEREIDARMLALRSVAVFSHLEDAELRTLAEQLVSAPFAAGDIMTRQGAIAHWLYILTAGEAEVWVESADARRRKVATIGPGDVFGEMGMMTGAARAATVTARTYTHCYRLDKQGFETVLRRRPEIAEDVSRVLVARTTGLQQVMAEARSEGNGQLTQDTLLQRIRHFFAL